MHAITLDATDCRILAVLQEEGRISNLDLAERISLSPSACLRRMRLLEEQGVIEHYRACLSREKLGFGFEAFVQVSMRNEENQWHERFAEALREWPEVVGAFVVTGESHYLLRVLAHNLKHYSDFVLNRLYKAPGVMDIRSNIVLQTLKDEAGAPVGLARTGRSKRCKAVEAAAVEHERWCRVRFHPHAAALHFADEDHVVAFIVAAAVVAFEPRERAVEHGHPRVAGRMRDPFEAVALVGREALAQVELRGREHVHHVMAVAAKHGRRRRFVREAPQHERRIERDRVERAGGDADQLAGRRARRDHRHA